jgi:ATP-dependent Lhr-like helicase
MSALEVFSPRTRDWFTGAFAGPTPAQEQAWPAIASGEHVLISAPTGSGKTLAAFLYGIDQRVATAWSTISTGARASAPVSRCRRRARSGPSSANSTPASSSPTVTALIDQLAAQPPAETAKDRRIRLVYISPLKALSYDIDRNLRTPIRGIGADLQVGVRTGDTPQKERAQMLRSAPDILITTPESLYLMLTGRAQSLFSDTRWCIIDEIHAVASTKRGSHLALTLERLSQASDHEVQRIGLSATQNPLEEVGRFMVGPRRTCRIVDTGVKKQLDLKIHVPVESMTELDDTPTLDLDPLAGGEATRRSIWPAIYPELVALINEHKSTIVRSSRASDP